MKTYCFQDLQSPAVKMLHQLMQARGWLETQDAFISDESFCFPQDIALTLEYKHLLALHLQTHHLDLMPLSFSIDDESWPQVLSTLPRHIAKWILKPSMLNNGQDIHLFHDPYAIVAHFQNQKRMGGSQVLQAYIDPPHLIKGPHAGHKYSLRFFVVACLPYGIFLYPDGYYNVSLFPYESHKVNTLEGHVTNEHLLPGRRNVIQIPSFQYQNLFSRCEEGIFKVLRTLFSHFSYPQTSSFKLAFFGMDLMLDAQEKVWLLEANHGPCFPITNDHPLQLSLYHDFWAAVMTELLEPFAHQRQAALSRFKPLYLLGK